MVHTKPEIKDLRFRVWGGHLWESLVAFGLEARGVTLRGYGFRAIHSTRTGAVRLHNTVSRVTVCRVWGLG